MDVLAYLDRSIATYDGDPPSNDYQRGCLDTLKVARAELGTPDPRDRDLVDEFLSAQAEIGEPNQVWAPRLYSAFEQWCRSSRRAKLGARRFSATLTDKGFKKVRRMSGGLHWAGLRLKADVA